MQITSASTPVNQEQTSEAAVATDSPKLGQLKIGKTLPRLITLNSCRDMQILGLEFGIKSINPLTQLAVCQPFWLVVV